jgi:hypothetical protein
MTKWDPFYFQYVGVEWIGEKVLKVDKKVFAQLLGIKSVDGALFHLQGNFPSHGFVELGFDEAMKMLTEEVMEGVDYERIRLLIHQDGVFVKNATEAIILNCTWAQPRHRDWTAVEDQRSRADQIGNWACES